MMTPASGERASEKFNAGAARAATALSGAARAARRALGATKADGLSQVAAVDWAGFDIKGWSKHGALSAFKLKGSGLMLYTAGRDFVRPAVGEVEGKILVKLCDGGGDTIPLTADKLLEQKRWSDGRSAVPRRAARRGGAVAAGSRHRRQPVAGKRAGAQRGDRADDRCRRPRHTPLARSDESVELAVGTGDAGAGGARRGGQRGGGEGSESGAVGVAVRRRKRATRGAASRITAAHARPGGERRRRRHPSARAGLISGGGGGRGKRGGGRGGGGAVGGAERRRRGGAVVCGASAPG
eukprot:6179652-Pleurochrysis_carterae.AAC.6